MRTTTAPRRAALPAWLTLIFVAGIFGFVAVVLGARDARAADPTAVEVGAKVQAFYDSTKTFRAKFTQQYTIKVQGVKKSS
jgi:outer membrane lipoprotein-sorting protein